MRRSDEVAFDLVSPALWQRDSRYAAVAAPLHPGLQFVAPPGLELAPDR